MKQIQNSQKSIGKSIPAMDFKNLKKKIREPEVSILLSNLCDLHKKSIPVG
jgi:hypothetical protein